MAQLLAYIKNAKTFTFLPEQLVDIIENNYLPIENSVIKQAFNDGEINIWNEKRDEYYEYENGEDYFNKNYK